MRQKLIVETKEVLISNPDKLLFPEDGFTKSDIIDYYQNIAPIMIPHVYGRPMTLQRFPDGINKEGFYQKEVSPYFPDWIKRGEVTLNRNGAKQRQLLCNDAATLVYIANLACITPHIWLSRIDMPYNPDKMIFDLDPPDDDFNKVRAAALIIKDELAGLGLSSYAMTTGSKGIHVAIPLDRVSDNVTVHAFSKRLSVILSRKYSGILTSDIRLDKRNGRIFVDYLRNAYAQTGVAPYAVRAKKGAPVAAPIDWHEIDSISSAQAFNIKNIFDRVRTKGDPWKDMISDPNSLKNARHLIS